VNSLCIAYAYYLYAITTQNKHINCKNVGVFVVRACCLKQIKPALLYLYVAVCCVE